MAHQHLDMVGPEKHQVMGTLVQWQPPGSFLESSEVSAKGRTYLSFVARSLFYLSLSVTLTSDGNVTKSPHWDWWDKLLCFSISGPSKFRA